VWISGSDPQLQNVKALTLVSGKFSLVHTHSHCQRSTNSHGRVKMNPLPFNHSNSAKTPLIITSLAHKEPMVPCPTVQLQVQLHPNSLFSPFLYSHTLLVAGIAALCVSESKCMLALDFNRGIHCKQSSDPPLHKI